MSTRKHAHKAAMAAATSAVQAAATTSASAAASQATATASWWSLLVSDVHCVLQRDPAARNLLEAWTIYPGVHAIAHHRIAHALWARG